MVHLATRSRPTASIPTSSMADIAFLLLVFFLVTTVFDEERGLQLVLPAHGETRSVPPRNLLFLIVDAEGVVAIRRGESPQIQRVRASEVAAVWRREASENPNLIASVHTDPGARYEHMIAVLDALKTAGATRISLQALEP
jgi:biopolymer transport protein ExbD